MKWHGYYPEPLRELPDDGTPVWSALPGNPSIAMVWVWQSRNIDAALRQWLQRGRLHLSREAAEAHARFEIEQAGGVV